MKNYTDLVTSAAPTAAARVRLRPVDARGVAIRDGLLADRQRVNREVTLLRGAEELERAGTLDNLRIAAGRARASGEAWSSATRTSTSGSRRSRGSAAAGPWIFPELNQKGWKYNDQYGIVPIPTNHAG